MSSWLDTYQVWLTESQSLANAQNVVNYFKAKGWAKESIAALCGNMRKESSINPNMYEYGYAWEADRGYGLVQWTPRSKYWNWATGAGLAPEVAESQLARIDYEQTNNIQWGPKVWGTPPYNFHAFATNQNGDSVATLTEYFLRYYEAPASLSSLSERVSFANRVYNELDWTGAGGTVLPAYPVNPGTPITSPFSQRINPVTGLPENHLGTDWGGALNDPIYAIMGGTVIASATDPVMGEHIIIQHTADTKFSRYQHLNSRMVSTGASVSRGQQIAAMGTTGESTGVHLHMSVSTSQWSGYIDPEVYLATAQGGGGQQPTPSGSVSSDTEQAQSEQKEKTEMIYTVKAGDTLGAIAKRYGASVSSIRKIEPIKNINLINVGEVLYIPGSSKIYDVNSAYPGSVPRGTYTVKAGDTLGAIASKNGMTYQNLLTFNPSIKDPDKIYPGQIIQLGGL